MSAKRNGADSGAAVDELRDDIAQTRADLGGTVGALAEKTDVKKQARKAKERAADQMGESARRHPVRWGGIVAGLLAAVAAIGALRWRQSRRPKNRAERVWHDVKSRAKDVQKDVKSRAKDVQKDVKSRAKDVRKDARSKARGVKRDAKRAALQMKGRMSR